MAIEVFIERYKQNKAIDVGGKITVKELLKKLDISPVTVITVKDNELITEDTVLNDKDKIKVMSVVSGG